MFSFFSTIPADTHNSGENSPSSAARTSITWALLTIWSALMCFAVLSIANPPWMQKLSELGKHAETIHYKHYGDNELLRKQNYRSAIAQYRKAVEIDPENIGALVNMAISYSRLGDEKTAFRLFADVLKHEGVQKGVIYYNIAEVLEKSGKIEQAIKYYERALGKDLDPVTVYNKLGQMYVSVGRFEEAREALQTALEIRTNLNYSYREMLRRTVGLSQNDTVHLNAVETELAREIGETELAAFDIEVIRQMQSRDKELAHLHHGLGVALLGLADTTGAASEFRTALQLVPNNSESAAMLRQLTTTAK